MGLRMKIQTSPFGSFTEVDFSNVKVYDLKVASSYEHPRRCSFCVHAPQHTMPLGIRNFIRLWDDGAVGMGGSEANPIFEGFLEDVDPGQGSNIVEYTALDPTHYASKKFNLMSEAWQEADTSGSDFPVPLSTGFPRLVYNSTIDNDDDYAYSRLLGATVGQIIADIFDLSYHALYWSNAAPGDGSNAGNGVAYEQAELDALTVVPQEKIVIETEGIRPAIERILQRYQPAHKLIWYPGTDITDRRWHFVSIEDKLGTLGTAGTTSEDLTLTLNDADADNLVLTMNIDRSLEDRWTAVKYFGPATILDTVARTGDGSLTDISDAVDLQTTMTSCCNVPGLNRWQITDSTKRTVARLLLQWREVQISEYGFTWTRAPFLYAYYPEYADGSVVGGVRVPHWEAVPNWQLDAKNGIIYTGSTYVTKYNPNPDPGEPNYVNPTEVAFIYGRPASPLQVRYPTSGFEGSAYDIANIENELQIYDEMLSVGQDANTLLPVTTSQREAAYREMARCRHNQSKDLVHTGGCVLHGIKYDFLNLEKRVNFAAVDGDNNPLSTGWESIRAVLTDIELDFEQMITTMQLSSDQSSLIGIDPEQMKQQLRIKALEYRSWAVMTQKWVRRQMRFGDKRFGAGIGLEGQVWMNQMTIQQGGGWYDPETGQLG